MAFNPNEHMMKLKGKDYLQVAWRLVWFREDHPDFGIETEALDITDDHALFKTVITDPTGHQVSSGHGSESKKDFGDFIEKAETKAVGRALAMLGYGTQFAADELDEGERIVDSPIDRAPRGSAEAAQDAGQKKLEALNAQQAQMKEAAQDVAPVTCARCGKPITGWARKDRTFTASEVVDNAIRLFGAAYCYPCCQTLSKMRDVQEEANG